MSKLYNMAGASFFNLVQFFLWSLTFSYFLYSRFHNEFLECVKAQLYTSNLSKMFFHDMIVEVAFVCYIATYDVRLLLKSYNITNFSY